MSLIKRIRKIKDLIPDKFKYLLHLIISNTLKFLRFTPRKEFESKIHKFLNSKKAYLIPLIILIIAVIGFSTIHHKVFRPNVTKTIMIYIPSGSDYRAVYNLLKTLDVLEDSSSFDWVAKKKKYPSLIRPGAYKIKKDWNNYQLVSRLRSGIQTPVKVIFHNIRFMEDLAGNVSKSLEPDSLTFLSYFNSDSLARTNGFTSETFPCIFIPNTYEFYWTTTPEKFVQRMKKEYDKFWTETRKEKANNMGLTLPEVSILASIVQEETIMKDEKSRISGVYLNRLKKGWPLQADPTVKFALRDFTVKRILTKYTKIDSPYNTYKYKGLPPGPINLPDKESLDAVLNSELHEFMYFSAKEDFSGYHYFSKTLDEHVKYAIKYRRALNKNKIMR